MSQQYSHLQTDFSQIKQNADGYRSEVRARTVGDEKQNFKSFHSQNTEINPHFTSFGNFFSLSDVRFIGVCEIGEILQIEQIL